MTELNEQDELTEQTPELLELIDQVLICAACGHSFMWTVSEQNFFHDKGLRFEPKRCYTCRTERREYFAQERIARNRTRQEVTQ